MSQLELHGDIGSAGRVEAAGPVVWGEQALKQTLYQVTKPMTVLESRNGRIGACTQDIRAWVHQPPADPNKYALRAYVPPLGPQTLGGIQFKRRHGLRYAYIVGAMANGITSVDMVAVMGKAGMLGFFGSAGMAVEDIDRAIHQVQQRLGAAPFGFNLIHAPSDPMWEEAVVRLYLDRGVRLISASAYLDLTLPLVYYRVKGTHRDHGGGIICPNRIMAKVSRIEVAKKFMSPPPDKLLKELVQSGRITGQEAALAAQVPMADDITAEADSGGHTDNRPAITLFPIMSALRHRLAQKYCYAVPPGVGLAGGIATPQAAAAAFAMGADYILAGSIHQACTESGTSTRVRQMLAEARQADVIMAPAADMFEMGIKVQVLKRGSMFPMKAAKLFDLYTTYSAFDVIPSEQKALLEKTYFKCSYDQEWQRTKSYFTTKNPQEIVRAEKDPKHKMALVFRSYLGKSSTWAKTGAPDRQIDYQIWCGPSMGAFNQWVKGTFLEPLEDRQSVTVAMNLLMGAAVLTRVNWLQAQDVQVAPVGDLFPPMRLSKISDLLDG